MDMRSWRGVWSMAVLVLLCATRAEAGEARRYVFGSGVDPSGPYQVIAEAKGFFAKHGVHVTVKKFSSATAAFRALQAGEIDAAVPGTLTPVSALAQGASNFRIVGSTRLTQNKFSAAVVDKTISKPQDLVGKKVAMAQGSPSSHLWFENYARYHKLDGVQRIWLQPQEQLIAFSKGEVDAIFIWRPWYTKALEVRPGSRILAYDADIGHVNDTPITFSTKLMEDRESAKAILRALIDADEFLAANRKEGAEIIGKAFNISAAETLEILDTVGLKVQLSDATFKDLCDNTRFLRETGKLQSAPNWKQAVVPDLLREEAPARVNYTKFIECQ